MTTLCRGHYGRGQNGQNPFGPAPMPQQMPQLAKDIELIREFICQHNVRLSRFENLRTRPSFESLNQRRMRDRIYSDAQLGRPQAHTCRWIKGLADWITRDEVGLLAKLGITPDRQRLLASLAGSATIPISGIDVTSQILLTASQGCASAAVSIGMTVFRRRLTKDVAHALSVLPSVLYVLYRYCSPHEMTSSVENITRQLKAVHRKGIPGSIDRDLSLAQIACALNERGHGPAAEALFFSPEIRRLTVSSLPTPWPQTPLLRNVAVYWALHGRRPQKAIEYLKQSDNYDQNSLNNRRAGATVYCQTVFVNQQDKSSKAWEAIEPYYHDSRERLIAAANSHNVEMQGIVHLYSGLYYGALARCLAAKSHFGRSEIQDDLQALHWCQSVHGPIEIDDVLIEIAPTKLPPELAQLRQRTLRSALQEYQARAFIDLGQVLAGH
jgi:hypothetical protein